jgi:hypothetical protein
MLPESLLTFLVVFESCFTTPSCQRFLTVMTGWVLCGQADRDGRDAGSGPGRNVAYNDESHAWEPSVGRNVAYNDESHAWELSVGRNVAYNDESHAWEPSVGRNVAPDEEGIRVVVATPNPTTPRGPRRCYLKAC